MPRVAGTLAHGRVLPPSWQREHWGERLGVNTTGCYDEILARLDIPKLLRRRCWSRTERWMLESWREAKDA